MKIPQMVFTGRGNNLPTMHPAMMTHMLSIFRGNILYVCDTDSICATDNDHSHLISWLIKLGAIHELRLGTHLSSQTE